MRIVGICMHIRFSPAVPRAPRHGGSLYHGSRFREVQPECLQYRGRNRFRHREAPANYCTIAGDVAILEGRGFGVQHTGYGYAVKGKGKGEG